MISQHLVTAKAKLSLFLTASLASFISTSLVPVIALVALILIDLAFGISVSIKKEKAKDKKKSIFRIIKSSGLRNTFNKIKDYLLLILTVFIFEEVLIGQHIQLFGLTVSFTFATVFALGFIEVKSINENFTELRGVGMLQFIFKLVKSKEGLLDTLEEDLEKETDKTNKT